MQDSVSLQWTSWSHSWCRIPDITTSSGREPFYSEFLWTINTWISWVWITNLNIHYIKFRMHIAQSNYTYRRQLSKYLLSLFPLSCHKACLLWLRNFETLCGSFVLYNAVPASVSPLLPLPQCLLHLLVVWDPIGNVFPEISHRGEEFRESCSSDYVQNIQTVGLKFIARW